MAFSGLEAEEDMRGRRLRTNTRRSQTDSSVDTMTRWVGYERRRRWETPRHWEERDSWSGDGRDKGCYNNWKDYNTANWEASFKSGTVAKRIQHTREEEKRNHRIREEAWNAGLLGRRDEQSLLHFTLCATNRISSRKDREERLCATKTFHWSHKVTLRDENVLVAQSDLDWSRKVTLRDEKYW
ncbi:hypothetical protein L3X38_032754 [Prunus dulcis]|uniref:Uncharacterized protein n=1 Tax=Prunus dulcis TaxID=3755 RepID=A0AAD4VGC5_PRUDU|nr:hypothetical protein L3X38_032754 [Prunus dulcis]